MWNGNQGTLSVYISKAKDLPNLIKLDKQNVILRLRIAHMTRDSETVFRGGQNPVFNYLERFEITPGVKPIMQLEAYCDRKKKVPLIIGRCEVDLMNGIRADPKEGYCRWYDLKRDGNEFAGTIFVELTFVPTVKNVDRGRSDDSSLDRLDMSMASRPVPPLPDDVSLNSSYNPQISAAHSEQGYMHASEIRLVTPSRNKGRSYINDSNPSISESHYHNDSYATTNNRILGNPPNFSTSVGTSNTTLSEETTDTTASDTKFHFANLKKLKERINIFKNPTASSTESSQSGNAVDIEALQKAIGVTYSDDDESDESEEINKDKYENNNNDRYVEPSSRRISHLHNHERNNIHRRQEPDLPPLPSESSRRSSMSPSRSRVGIMHSPDLPPLPKSRNTSLSPTRRRPPPNN